MRQYQYQALVEPVLVPAAPAYDPAGLEWLPSYRQAKLPIWSKARTDVAQTVFAELPIPDVGWYGSDNRFVPLRPVPNRSQEVQVLQPPTVDISWTPCQVEPPHKKRWPRGYAPSITTDYLETIVPPTVDWGWEPISNRVVPPVHRPRRDDKAQTFFATQALPEIGWMPYEGRFVTRLFVVPPQNRSDIVFVNIWPVMTISTQSKCVYLRGSEEDVNYRRGADEDVAYRRVGDECE
jgi:hypothetical protein